MTLFFTAVSTEAANTDATANMRGGEELPNGNKTVDGGEVSVVSEDSITGDAVEQVIEISAEMEQVNSDIEIMEEDLDNVRRVTNVMRSRQPQGMTEGEVQMATESFKNVFNRYGVSQSTVPSMESFNGVSGNRSYETTRYVTSMEGVGSKILDTMRAAFKKLVDFIKRLIGNTKAIKENLIKVLDRQLTEGKDLSYEAKTEKEGPTWFDAKRTFWDGGVYNKIDTYMSETVKAMKGQKDIVDFYKKFNDVAAKVKNETDSDKVKEIANSLLTDITNAKNLYSGELTKEEQEMLLKMVGTVEEGKGQYHAVCSTPIIGGLKAFSAVHMTEENIKIVGKVTSNNDGHEDKSPVSMKLYGLSSEDVNKYRGNLKEALENSLSFEEGFKLVDPITKSITDLLTKISNDNGSSNDELEKAILNLSSAVRTGLNTPWVEYNNKFVMHAKAAMSFFDFSEKQGKSKK